jgi:lipopolysaccharide/colanic/teichoic acid biosynthesis glycosyltransferase
MNLSTRRRNESLWKRLVNALQVTQESDGISSQHVFQTELAKEISRSNRRRHGREFALIHFVNEGRDNKIPVTDAMLHSFRQRIRITDTIGWHSSNLAVLLPETNRQGADLVSEDLVQLATEHGWKVRSEVYIYPWDDKLISISNQIALSSEGTDAQQTDVQSDRKEPVGFSDGFERVDEFQLDLGSDAEIDFNGSSSGAQPNSFDSSAGATAVQLSTPVVLAEQNETNGHAPRRPDLFLKNSKNGKSSRRYAALSPSESSSLNQLAGVTSTSMVRPLTTPWWKRTIDIIGAGVGLVVLSPVLLTAAVAIKVSSPGPVLFRQKREGKGGKSFDILKFRTMVVDAEAKQDELKDVSEQDGPAFKLKDDPRITSVGSKLRKSCVDELPQLVNVLMGEMSLVGPRPLPVSESTECEPWQRMRLTVLPGLTCTWQARGGRQVSFDQWMRMDLDYIKNQSFVSDVRLIMETAFIALLQRGSV